MVVIYGEVCMNNSTREFINNLAEQVIAYYNISIPVDNMERVVEKIGGKVEEKLDFDEYYDGTIRKNGDNSFSIVVSPLQSESRKKFTIAHELGHLFLHMGYQTNRELWNSQTDTSSFRRFGTSEQEYQANEFAGAFLMPEREYKKVMDSNTNNNMVNIKKVADYFGVSVAAAKVRGQFLRYLA